jgi:hypothetical protein
MKKTVRATDFLQNMAQFEQVAAPDAAPSEEPAKVIRATKTRDGLKHIRRYLSAVEKVAILRRLRLDNSKLITLAINELHARHNAKRAFGDS